MMNVEGLNHIGIAVRSIDAHRRFYEEMLDARYEGSYEIPEEKTRVAFLVIGPPGHYVRLELIEAASPDAAVSRFIEEHGEGLHHVAYTVEDLDRQMAALIAAGVKLTDLRPRDGVHINRRVFFVEPESANGILTEFCEVSLDPRKRES